MKMKNKIKFRILFLFSLFLNSCIHGQKKYISDLYGVGPTQKLSNKWQIPKKGDCIKSPWNHIPPSRQNPNPHWGVCFSSNCLLESTSYSIKNVKSVYAEILYISRYCPTITTTTTVEATKAPPQCTEYITVNANLFNVTSQPGILTEVGIRCPNSNDLKKNLSDPQFFESKQTVEFVNKGNKNNIKYLFDAEEACGSIKNFTVYYYKCPVVTKSLVKFDEHNAPNRSVGEETYKGKCIPNSVNIDGTELLMKCKWNGTVVTSGECVCKEGYEKKELTCSCKLSVKCLNV